MATIEIAGKTLKFTANSQTFVQKTARATDSRISGRLSNAGDFAILAASQANPKGTFMKVLNNQGKGAEGDYLVKVVKGNGDFELVQANPVKEI